MLCPNGHDVKQLVLESRKGEDAIYRRRYCCKCELRYTTKEQLFKGSIPTEVEKARKKK